MCSKVVVLLTVINTLDFGYLDFVLSLGRFLHCACRRSHRRPLLFCCACRYTLVVIVQYPTRSFVTPYYDGRSALFVTLPLLFMTVLRVRALKREDDAQVGSEIGRTGVGTPDPAREDLSSRILVGALVGLILSLTAMISHLYG